MLCNISQNAMGQTGGGTLSGPAGGGPCQVQPGHGGYPAGGGGYPAGEGGTLLGRGYPARGYQGRVPPLPPPPARSGQDGGYPVRTTEGVLSTRRAVCLLRSRRRTFLY